MSGRTSLAALLAILIVPAVATAQPHVWISSGKDIRQVTTSGNAIGSSKSVHLSTANAVRDVEYGPDARLYFAEHFSDKACISKVDPTGNVSGQTGANATYAQVFCSTQLVNELRQLRFDWTGALVFATSNHGVMKLAACALSTPATCTVAATSVISAAAGSAVGFALDGDLLYSDGSSIKRSPSTTGFPIAVLGPVALDVVTGGAGSFSALPTGAVCASSDNSIPCFKPSTTLGALYTFPSIDKAQGGALAKDDTGWWATSVNPLATVTPSQAPHNGLLWRITGNSATIIYPTSFNGPQPPIVDVALPLTSKTVTETTATDTHNFNFGIDLVSFVTPLPCKLTVTALERFASQVQPCLDSTGLSAKLFPYLSEYWPTEYEATILSGPCFTPGSLADVQIGAYFVPNENLALVHRPTGAPSGNNKCSANTVGQFLLGPLPEDAIIKGSSGCCSGFMGAQIDQPAQVATLQLLSPLQNAPFITTNPTQAQIDTAVEQNLGNVAVKFSLTKGGKLVTTKNAVLSVQRLGSLNTSGQLVPDSHLCTVQPQDAATGTPTFFTAQNTHRFNLDTSEMAPLECTQAGLYAIGISFPVDGIADPVTFLMEFVSK